MATKDKTEKREFLTCSLCLEVFRQPKLLSCSHTFCLQCLVALTSRSQSRTFPCPHCRQKITIPPGGIAGFQTNFYLQEEELERARNLESSSLHGNNGESCSLHGSTELKFYCISCKKSICAICKGKQHKYHQTGELYPLVARAQCELSSRASSLKSELRMVRQRADSVKSEKQAFQDKKRALETAIKNRHDTIVAAADKFRDQALKTLEEKTYDEERRLNIKVDGVLKELDDLSVQEETVLEALDSQSDSEKMLGAAAAVRSHDGRGFVCTSAKEKVVMRPFVHFDHTNTELISLVEYLMGSVSMAELQATGSEDEVRREFNLNEKDIEIASVHPEN